VQKLSLHPACSSYYEEDFLEATKAHLAISLRDATRVASTANRLASTLAADVAQRSAHFSNITIGALTVVLVLLGVMSLCHQVGEPLGVGFVVGLGVLAEAWLIYRAYKVLRRRQQFADREPPRGSV